MAEQTSRVEYRESPVLNQMALISAPWPVFSRPSIQLGALKAYLKSEFPDLKVLCHHFYLQVAVSIGYPVYQAISERTWTAECVYAAMLYPDRMDQIAALFAKAAKVQKNLRGLDFEHVVRRVRAVSEAFINRVDWPAMGLAGCSVCLCQLTSSLYFIREIKKRAPDLPIIAGGSIIGGHSARDLLDAFPEIGMIVTGEGEIPLTRLVGHLRAGGGLADFPAGAGIVSRNDERLSKNFSFSQLSDLTTLPAPDFGEYFAMLKKLPPEQTFFPTLPLEVSRGCWWRAEDPRTGERGCTFCNLNLQWDGYRSKSAAQAADEVNQSAEQYQLLSMAFMDNSLPPQKSHAIFRGLTDFNKDFQFFAEIRASTDKETLEVVSRAGMAEVQVGIEALSSNLLKKLNKGTSVTENLEIMKNLEILGIKHNSNLILQFPGSDEADVEETLRAIRAARVFYPLRIVHFWLGIQSPVWKNPEKFGIKAVFNHPNYKILFPNHVCRRVRFMIQDYRGDKQYQRKLWQPVKRAVKDWQEAYFDLCRDPNAGPILSFQDGGSFLIIRKRRPDDNPENHRLTGTSREIYLFCEHRRKIDTILQQFPDFSAEKIGSFLQLMIDKGLMFADNDEYLSLAIPARRGE